METPMIPMTWWCTTCQSRVENPKEHGWRHEEGFVHLKLIPVTASEVLELAQNLLAHSKGQSKLPKTKRENFNVYDRLPPDAKVLYFLFLGDTGRPIHRHQEVWPRLAVLKKIATFIEERS